MGEAQELTVALVKLTLDSLYGISTEIAHIVKFCLVDEPQEINCVNLYYCSIIVPVQFSSVQSLSCVRLFATSWIAARQASLSITISRSSHKLTSIEWVMLYSHLILCRPLLFLPPISPSIIVFSNESTLRMGWPKYWSFSFSKEAHKSLFLDNKVTLCKEACVPKVKKMVGQVSLTL